MKGRRPVGYKCLVLVSLLLPAASAFGVAAGKLVYGETGRLEGFDPYTVHESSGQRLGDLLFDSLVEIGPGGKYEAALAKSWTVENGGTSVKFKLRDDVVWHNGTRLTPNDVVVTVRLILAATSEIPNRERFSAIEGTDATAKDTVTIRMKRASIDPLRMLMFKILPSEMVGAAPALKRGGAFSLAPIGTGPYQFVKSTSQGEVLLSANTKYFRRAPKIPNIIMKAYADQSVMAQSLMFNSLDLVTYVSPRDLPEVMGDRKLSVVAYDALSYSFLALNTSRGPLKDKRVRQAIGYAINRAEMLDAFFQGKGRLITGPFPDTSWAYNLDVKPSTLDLERARQLLGAAGFVDVQDGRTAKDKSGKELKLLFAVPLAGESETIKRIVLAFQGYLAKVGIAVDLQFMDWVVWKKRVLSQHDYDMTLASWSFDDASNITSLFHSSSAVPWGNNFVMYRNPEVDALLTEADVTSDFDKKRAISQKLHAILADEAPYIYLWTLTHYAAHNVRVKGVRVEPFAFFKFVTSWDLEGSGKK